MATIPGALLVAISSPYARRGELWRAYKDHYGVDGDPVLVWKAPTEAMNPVVDPRVIADAYAADPAAARAEYGAEFRTDIESFLTREIVEACVVPGRRVLPPMAGVPYTAFVDPSGGVGDSFALAIAHREQDRVLLGLVHERRAPLSPEATVAEFVEILRPYRVTTVHGDRYSEELIRERFRAHGITYAVSDRDRSALYVEMLPLLTSGRAQLLDAPRLITQLLSLERRTGGSGKDTITHPRDGHDDVSNAAAGALVRAARRVIGAFHGYRFEAPAGPLAEPRWWTCPTCHDRWLTDASEPVCPACRSQWSLRETLGF
jgi:hypothetical protein